jgi:hypothetical protein
MSAYPNCRFCHGLGCLACDGERAKAEARASQPIFTLDLDDPQFETKMAQLREVIGAEALDQAAGMGALGVALIRFNLARLQDSWSQDASEEADDVRA